MAEPKFEITPKHVIQYFREEYRMQVSEADARRWLKARAHTFATELKRVVAPKLSDIFGEATLTDYPSQEFTRFYRKVDGAIAIASDEYAEKIGMEYSGDSMFNPDRCQMVTFLMKSKAARVEALCRQQFCFVEKGAPFQMNAPYTSFCLHIVVDGKKVRARILEPGEAIPPELPVFGEEEPPPRRRPEKDQRGKTQPSIQ